MAFFSKIKGGIYHGIGFALVLGTIGITYAAYEALTNVNSGETLTATSFNKVLENQRTFRSEIDNLNTAVLAVVPSGAVMAFKTATCPAGWKAADGVNATPDLRGEFIRGLDNGRGVDSGRGLSSFQGQDWKGFYMTNTLINSHLYSHYDVYMGKSTSSYIGNLFVGARIAPAAGMGTKWDNSEVRPRNVALLYCVKN